jgi:hypothetical protein
MWSVFGTKSECAQGLPVFEVERWWSVPVGDEERMRSRSTCISSWWSVFGTKSECAQGPPAFEAVGLREGRGTNALKIQLHLKVNDVVGLRDKERMRSRSTCISS